MSRYALHEHLVTKINDEIRKLKDYIAVRVDYDEYIGIVGRINGLRIAQQLIEDDMSDWEKDEEDL